MRKDLFTCAGASPDVSTAERERTIRRLQSEVCACFEEEIRLAGNMIAQDEGAIEQLRIQARMAVTATLEEFWSGPARLPSGSRGPEGRASRDVSAACLLFDTALDVLHRELPAADVTALARSLNQIICGQLVSAVAGHTNALTSVLCEAHERERRRISRELHDRVAHAVGVGLQNIEMHELYRPGDQARAAAKLAAATEILRESLETVRGLAAGLRGSQDREPEPDRAHNAATGPVDALTPELSEELHIVLREAIHNALVHGHSTQVGMSIEVTDAGVAAEVADDGVGFAPAEELREPSGIGLPSMRERLELLGGTVTWSSTPDNGTVVRVRVGGQRTCQ